MFKYIILFIILIACQSCVQKAETHKNLITEQRMESSIKHLYIDYTGSVVIDSSNYRSAGSFSEGLAAVESKEGKWGFIGKSGEVVIKPQFQYAGNFSEGLALVESQGKRGFIDKTGRMIIEPQYDLACEFSEGISVVERGGKLLLIDKTGQTVLSLDTNEIELQIYENVKFSNGLIKACAPKESKCGYIDRTGKFVIEPKYNNVAPFAEGLARVSIVKDGEEKLGFINQSGEFIIPPTFNTDGEFLRNSTDFSEDLSSLTENLAPTVTEEEKFVYIDKAGVVVMATDFFYAGPFRDGLATVYDDKSNKYGFINKSGKLVIPLQYDSVTNFSEGLAAVTISNSSTK